MYSEELIEEGIVTEVKNGIALVSITPSNSCEECSAKIFCHSENNTKNVTARDTYGVKTGDKVQISIKGRNIVAASFLLYGFPSFLFVVSIFIGMNLFKENSELLSSLSSVAIVGIYYLTYHLISKRNKNKFLPKIIFVSYTK